MTTHLKVGLKGFTDRSLEKLERIFQTTGNRERSYSIATQEDESDLLIVDISENPVFDSQKELGSMSCAIPVVTAGAADHPEGSDYHIKGMLLASRVIRVLDQVVVPGQERHESEAGTTAAVGPVEAIDPPADELQVPECAVLVVDDSELMRKSIALELGKSPMAVAVDFAESGEQALQKVAEQQYDFMFLDVMMPGIDGYETCTQIRKIAALKRMPIIMLSAKTSPLDEVKGIMAGCTSYITKPIESNEFQNMLDRVMSWLGNYKKVAG